MTGDLELVVFGAHLRGGPPSHQLTDLGAHWAGEIFTAPRYRMSVLATVPPKPARNRPSAAGDSCHRCPRSAVPGAPSGTRVTAGLAGVVGNTDIRDRGAVVISPAHRAHSSVS